MMRLLQWLFSTHVHKWETKSEHDLVNKEGKRIGVCFIQQCQHCGKLIRLDLR